MILFNRLKHTALQHYKRMIGWVKTQDLDSDVDIRAMQQALDEWWIGSDCSYCTKYIIKCDKCPLHTESLGCCNGLWYHMHISRTWKDWLGHAEAVYAFIEKHG